MKNKKLISFTLRLGLAAVFSYAGVAALVQPGYWLGFVPGWIVYLLPAQIFLTVFAFFQIILAIWLLSGVKPRSAAIVSAVTLFFIFIFNLESIDIVFRDVDILVSAITLALLSSQ